MIEEAQLLLKNHSYLYENLDIENSDKAFRSDFLITLLAEAHVPAVKGYLDVRGLVTSTMKDGSDISGVLGFCAAAVSLSCRLL